MKVTGKITKTEWLLLAVAALFLAFLALLYVRGAAAAEGTDYTITTARQAEEIVTPEASGPVDINTAGLEQLQTLKGIGPALAQRIIDFREENGPFQSVEDLLQVKGIGEATLEKFRDHVTVGPEGPTEDQPAEEADG